MISTHAYCLKHLGKRMKRCWGCRLRRMSMSLTGDLWSNRHSGKIKLNIARIHKVRVGGKLRRCLRNSEMMAVPCDCLIHSSKSMRKGRGLWMMWRAGTSGRGWLRYMNSMSKNSILNLKKPLNWPNCKKN